jgi:two-component system, NtrC family, C4-dicarboxylate transport sensor histidine kinase DctB
MTDIQLKRRWVILGFLLGLGIITAAVWASGFRQALDQLAQRAQADLALATDRLSAQLQRYQETAVLIAAHPALDNLDTPDGARAAHTLLLDVADKVSALNVSYADHSGTVLVDARESGVRNLGGMYYFQRAMQGALGSAHGIDPYLNQRAYYYAAPDFGPDGKVRGVLLVSVDVENIEWDWRGSTPAVFFTDDTGEVFISNRSEILFWTRPDTGAGLIPAQGSPLPFNSRVVGDHELWTLGWGPYLPGQALHMVQDLPTIGMQGEVLVDIHPARRLAMLQAATVAAICLAFGAMLFLATERRRTLAQANARLETRVQERTSELSDTNEHLRHEVAERKEAEAALKRAQADLVQADKLSALGQMSAGISHELNQPLMAIQQFADNGSAFLNKGKPQKAGENLNRISQMATRMARIIRNLRAFARNESEPMSKVDLVQVINTAIELTETRLKSQNVRLDWRAPPNPVYAWGGEVRLAQVFVNLINNAADAMQDQQNRHIRIALNPGTPLSVTVRDIGPGLKEPEKIFDPFYSTKTVGSSEGMGLGLSISYGLLQSFGGNIRGTNTETGAEFTVELDHWQEENAA